MSIFRLVWLWIVPSGPRFGSGFARASQESRLNKMDNLKKCLVILGLLSTVSGCTSIHQWWHNGWKVGPNYCPASAEVACDWKETDANTESIVAGSPIDACWWGTFEDPQLNALIAMLHRQNLSLREAVSRIEEARALRAVAVGIEPEIPGAERSVVPGGHHGDATTGPRGPQSGRQEKTPGP